MEAPKFATKLFADGEPESPRALEWALLATIIGVAALLRLWNPDLAYFNIHAERDLYRALMMVRGVEFPLLGSEMQYGGRLFGPFLYFLLAPPMLINPSPVAVNVYFNLVNVAVIGGVWWFLRQVFNWPVAVIAAGFYAVFPLDVWQTRFLWNPCFLPLLCLGALWGGWMWIFRGRRWHLLTCLFFLLAGIQIHLSMIHLLVSLLVVALVARAPIAWRTGGGALLLTLVMFSPWLYSEAFGDSGNLESAISAPESAMAETSKRYTFNPNGIPNFFYHVRLQMHEDVASLGLTVLAIAPRVAPVFGGTGYRIMDAISRVGVVEIVLWMSGAGALLWATFQRRERRTTAIALMIFLPQAIPSLVMSFFNYHAVDGNPINLAPIRYYLVSYPFPFLTKAVGVWVLFELLGRAGSAGRFLRWLPIALAAAIAVAQTVFSLLFLDLISRSGRAIPYYVNEAPNLETMIWARNTLLGEARIDREAFLNRTSPDLFGDMYNSEASLDYLVLQDERSKTNPPPPADLWWVLASDFIAEGRMVTNEPDLPEGTEVLRQWALGDRGYRIYEVRLPAGTPEPGDPLRMRNFYFSKDPMQYLNR